MPCKGVSKVLHLGYSAVISLLIKPVSTVLNSDGSGSKFFDPSRVSHLWFGFEFGKFPIKFFNFFPFRSKKISSGRVRKYPGQRRVGILFTAAWVGSGQGPSLVLNPNHIRDNSICPALSIVDLNYSYLFVGKFLAIKWVKQVYPEDYNKLRNFD